MWAFVIINNQDEISLYFSRKSVVGWMRLLLEINGLKFPCKENNKQLRINV